MNSSRQKLFELGLENGLRYLDRGAGLCFYSADHRPGFQGRRHDDAQSTVLTAGGLLIRNAPGDSELALQILRALARTEPSWNVGFRLFLLCWIANEMSHAGRRDAELKAALNDAIAGAAGVVAARRPGHVHRPGYTNFWLLDTVGLILAGEYLASGSFLCVGAALRRDRGPQRPDGALPMELSRRKAAPTGGTAFFPAQLRQRGLAMLREFETLQSRLDAPEEFNSPTYFPVQVSALIGLRQFCADPAVVRRAARLEKWLWRHFARHYDQAAGVLTGPWSRAYEEDRDGQQPLIRLMMAGFCDDAPAWKWVAARVRRQPPDLAWGILFARLRPGVRHQAGAAPRCVVEALPPGPVGGAAPVEISGGRAGPSTSLRAGALTLGAVSRWHLWEQAVPMTLHERGRVAPVLYHCQPTGREASTRFGSAQKGTELLAAFTYIVPTKSTNMDMGVTRGVRIKPLIVTNELRFRVRPRSIRLFVNGKPVVARSRLLPAGKPILVAGQTWAVGLILGPASRRAAGRPRLKTAKDRVAIVMTSADRPARLKPGEAGPYGWYYLCAVEIAGPDDLTSLIEDMSGMIVRDACTSAGRRVIRTGGRPAPLRVRIGPTAAASCWMSNGWAAR